MLHTGNYTMDEKLRAENAKQAVYYKRLTKQVQARNCNASVGKQYYMYGSFKIPAFENYGAFVAAEIMSRPVEVKNYVGVQVLDKKCVQGVPCVDGGGHGSKQWCAMCEKVM